MKNLISFKEFMSRQPPHPVGTRMRDPDKPDKVKKLEAAKARKENKPYGRQKDAIDKMFTGN